MVLYSAKYFGKKECNFCLSESYEMLGLINFFLKMDCLMEKSTVFGWLFEMIMGKITLFDLAMIEEIFFHLLMCIHLDCYKIICGILTVFLLKFQFSILSVYDSA